MSKTIGLMVLLACLFSSCGEKVQGQSNSKKEITPVEQTNTTTIPSMNYDEFEANYLNRKDDKTYVVNFWATWCGPCVKELPLFENVTATYPNEDVEVILVSIDMAKMKESHLVKFVEKHNLQSEVVHLDDTNMNRWIPLIDKDWSGAIPVTIFYNKDKRLFIEDSFEEGELVKTLNEFIN